MIDTLSHLPRPDAGAAELADRFSDLAPPLTARQAALESARCLYCYDAPCVNACPSEIDIPSFIRNISHENVQGAAEKILSANILGGSCARVCPTEILCQQACVRNNAQECAPVLIGLLQRHAIDHAQFSEHPFQRAPASGKRIAVVGAGPAGLSCAHRLALHGHEVVVFEAREKAGGLNEYGIAKYKLVDDFAQRELDFLLQIVTTLVGVNVDVVFSAAYSSLGKYIGVLSGPICFSSIRVQHACTYLCIALINNFSILSNQSNPPPTARTSTQQSTQSRSACGAV